jgi:hypothetical protein
MNNEHDKVNFFIYRNVAYGVGTKVKLKEPVHYKTYNTNITKNDTYVFYLGCKNGVNIFNWCGPEDRRKVFRGDIWIKNCDEDIEEIVEPVYPHFISWQKNAMHNILSEETVADVFGGILIYIVVMAIGTIFEARLLIWLFATAVFVWWLLNQYRT